MRRKTPSGKPVCNREKSVESRLKHNSKGKDGRDFFTNKLGKEPAAKKMG